MKRVSIVLAVASLLVAWALAPSLADSALSYDGPFLAKFGPTFLCASATTDADDFCTPCCSPCEPIPGVCVAFHLNTLWNTGMGFGPAQTNVLGKANAFGVIGEGLYDVHVLNCDNLIPPGEGVLTVYNCFDAGIFAGGKLRQLSFGGEPNIEKTPCPRDIQFGLEYRLDKKVKPAGVVLSNGKSFELGPGCPSALLIVDNDNPLGPVKICSTSFTACVSYQATYGVVTKPVKELAPCITFYGYAHIDTGDGCGCLTKRFCAQLIPLCRELSGPTTTTVQKYAFKIDIFDITGLSLYEICPTCIDCGGVYLNCVDDH